MKTNFNLRKTLPGTLSLCAVALLAACASGPTMAPFSQASLPDAVKVPAGHSVALETAAAA